MATKKPKAKRTKGNSNDWMSNVRTEGLGEYGSRAMGIYAEAVNLDRAVPDLIDGLKPVQRRILWAAFQLPNEFNKTAKVVGECIGNFHPHGDSSVSGAIETMMHQNAPLLRGRGNWGTLLDSAAAMRYTNCMISAYGHTMFDPNYIAKAVTMFVPNYDDKNVEPVTLPALLPNVLINGGEGIGVGTTTNLPTFTPESLLLVIQRLLKGEKLTAQDFADTLVYNYRYGGERVKSKANRAAWNEMFTTNKARVEFRARLTVRRDDKAIEITDWPQGMNITKFIEKVQEFKEVASAENFKGALGFRIEMRRDHNFAQFDKLVEKVQKLTTKRRSFRINVTKRVAKIDDGIVTYDTQYLSLSVPKLIMAWLQERLALEKRSLAYRIEKQGAAIAYSKLMIWVSRHADEIIACIRKSMDPSKDLQKKFKLSAEQAQAILDLQLRRISKLDQAGIEKKLAEQKKFLTQLEAWMAKPKQKILADTQMVFEAIEKDRKFEASKANKVEVI